MRVPKYQVEYKCECECECACDCGCGCAMAMAMAVLFGSAMTVLWLCYECTMDVMWL